MKGSSLEPRLALALLEAGIAPSRIDAMFGLSWGEARRSIVEAWRQMSWLRPESRQ